MAEMTDIEVMTLGVGLASPLQTSTTKGDLVAVSGADNVVNVISDLITTQVGERLMKEDIGTHVGASLFENVEQLAEFVPQEIVEVIQQYEPRVNNVRADFIPNPTNPSQIKLKVSWVVRSTGIAGSLVYPYG